MVAGKQAENRAVQAAEKRFPHSPDSAVVHVFACYSPLAPAGFS